MEHSPSPGPSPSPYSSTCRSWGTALTLTLTLPRYVSFSFDVDRGFDMHEITAMLPPLLQQEVFLNVHAPLVRKVPR